MVAPRMSYEEMSACVRLGITWEKYQSLPGSSIWLDENTPMSKCDVIMWYRYDKIVPLVLDDIAASRMRR